MLMCDNTDGTAGPTMAMVNREGGGAFAYSTSGKSILADSQWILRRVRRDMDNCGHRNAKTQVRSDQGAAINAVQG